MNPLVRDVAQRELGDCNRMHIIEPLDVIDCHNFEARAYLCLTDSGGIQEECSSYGVPVLVMRNTTERPGGVQAGTLMLVGTDENSIYRNFNRLLDDKKYTMQCVMRAIRMGMESLARGLLISLMKKDIRHGTIKIVFNDN